MTATDFQMIPITFGRATLPVPFRRYQDDTGFMTTTTFVAGVPFRFDLMASDDHGALQIMDAIEAMHGEPTLRQTVPIGNRRFLGLMYPSRSPACPGHDRRSTSLLPGRRR